MYFLKGSNIPVNVHNISRFEGKVITDGMNDYHVIGGQLVFLGSTDNTITVGNDSHFVMNSIPNTMGMGYTGYLPCGMGLMLDRMNTKVSKSDKEIYKLHFDLVKNLVDTNKVEVFLICEGHGDHYVIIDNTIDKELTSLNLPRRVRFDGPMVVLVKSDNLEVSGSVVTSTESDIVVATSGVTKTVGYDGNILLIRYLVDAVIVTEEDEGSKVTIDDTSLYTCVKIPIIDKKSLELLKEIEELNIGVFDIPLSDDRMDPGPIIRNYIDKVKHDRVLSKGFKKLVKVKNWEKGISLEKVELSLDQIKEIITEKISELEIFKENGFLVIRDHVLMVVKRPIDTDMTLACMYD